MLVTISKASPIGSQVIDNLTIIIGADELTQRRMQRDADAIVETLHATLPQGTWARLVAGIAKRWAENTEGIISANEWYRPIEETHGGRHDD